MRLAAVALVILATTASRAGVAAAAGRESQIQAAYDHQCTSAIGKDRSGFAGTLDPGYVAIDLDRDRVTPADILDAIETPPQGTIVETCHVLIRGFQDDGPTATVLETETSSGTVINEGLAKPYVRVRDSTDVWKTSGRPVEIASQWTGVRLTVDGNVVQDRGILASPEP